MMTATGDSPVSSDPRRARRGSWVIAATILVVLALGVTVLIAGGAGGETPPSPAAPVSAAPVVGDPPAMGVGPTLRVAPDGTGDGAGEDWARAASLGRLSDLLRSAAPGTQVLLRADAGPYQVTDAVELAAGGTETAPVIIRGVNAAGAPMPAQFVGTRADPYRPNGDPGSEVFRLVAGANNLVFEDLAFRNTGNGCIRVGADISNLTIRRITATNVRRVLEDFASGGPPATATINGLHVADVTANGYSRAFMRLSNDSNHVLIENVRGDSQGQDGDDFAQGIQLGDTVHAVVIRNTSMVNAIDTRGRYWNGDGFSAEEGTYDVRFENTFAAGNTDSGYDIKTRGATLVNTVSQDNKRNYRFWGEATVQGCTARDPRSRGGVGSQSQVHATQTAQVTMTGCTITDDDPSTLVLNVDGTSRLTLRDTTVQHAPGGRLSQVDPQALLDAPDLQ